MGLGSRRRPLGRLITPGRRSAENGQNTTPDAAAASAMYVVLLAMVPAQRSAFEGAYKSIIGKIPEGEARERGVAFGEEVAKLFLEVRANDGMNVTGEYKPQTGPGQWKPTPPAAAPMALPNLVNVLPFRGLFRQATLCAAGSDCGRIEIA
jgi:hypothetical protein